MQINIQKNVDITWPWKDTNPHKKHLDWRLKFLKNINTEINETYLNLWTVKNFTIFKKDNSLTTIVNKKTIDKHRNNILCIYYPENSDFPFINTVCLHDPALILFPNTIYAELAISGKNLSKNIINVFYDALFKILNKNKLIENAKNDIFINKKKVSGHVELVNTSGLLAGITIFLQADLDIVKTALTECNKEITDDELKVTGILNEFPEYTEDTFINDFIFNIQKILEQEHVSY